ncbi:MAG TPA: sodium:solute symporter family protein, partial [Ureibacillus sp.]|nr:sodium:solute symporter family protein [Ureibacillus sp.]
GGNTLATLLLMGYSLMTQLFPSLLFSFMKDNFVNKYGAASGIICGIATVAYITISESTIGTLFPSLPQAAKDLNVGIIALVINLVVTIIVSLIVRKFTMSYKLAAK